MLKLFFLLLISSAQAGKLASGWKALPFGSDSVLVKAPLPGCLASTEPGIRWQCHDQIGGVNLALHYLSQEGLFWGVMVQCKGFDECFTFREILNQAWGPGRPKRDFATDTMDDRVWIDQTVGASWDWNQFTNTGTVLLLDKNLFERVRAADRDAARKAAEAL